MVVIQITAEQSSLFEKYVFQKLAKYYPYFMK